jgi:RNA polymerase sigma-70 factor (ECF subfamily)
MQKGYAVAATTANKPTWSTIQGASDEMLIARIVKGDMLAMQALYARHNVRVYRFILRMVGNESTAEDILNEVFLDAWRQADRFEARSQVSTWLLGIARYKALSSLRTRSNAQLDDQMAATIADPADNPEAVLERNDRTALVRRCLSQLSPAHREIIDLVYYHEKTVSEVARIVRVPENTVKTRMHYARKHLAKLIDAAGLSIAA